MDLKLEVLKPSNLNMKKINYKNRNSASGTCEQKN